MNSQNSHCSHRIKSISSSLWHLAVTTVQRWSGHHGNNANQNGNYAREKKKSCHKFCQFLFYFHSEYGLKILSPISATSIVTWSAIYVAIEKFNLNNGVRTREIQNQWIAKLGLWLRLFHPIWNYKSYIYVYITKSSGKLILLSQSASSDLSWQSISPLHRKCASIHCPFSHWYWDAEHMGQLSSSLWSSHSGNPSQRHAIGMQSISPVAQVNWSGEQVGGSGKKENKSHLYIQF